MVTTRRRKKVRRQSSVWRFSKASRRAPAGYGVLPAERPSARCQGSKGWACAVMNRKRPAWRRETSGTILWRGIEARQGDRSPVYLMLTCTEERQSTGNQEGRENGNHGQARKNGAAGRTEAPLVNRGMRGENSPRPISPGPRWRRRHRRRLPWCRPGSRAQRLRPQRQIRPLREDLRWVQVRAFR